MNETSTSDSIAGDGVLSAEQWRAEASRLFGPDPLRWRFVCPSCGHVAAVEDWKNAGAKDTQAAFSCVGRYIGADDSRTFRKEGGPCTYAGGGLIRLNPVAVRHEDGAITHVFAFAGATTAAAA
ncbi:VVA0879 family protein [Variovorax sp. JS1663]|uniref:VVA0879 family protein n=1 Tax=Variovorax sp. JS1663 TaxID=1851577 RepID=UPI0011816241|nr:VVA0879 family protein [Variovorax sp. JS1663]